MHGMGVVVLIGVVEKVTLTQAVEFVDPAGDHLPASHSVQVVEPDSDHLPASHSVQLGLCQSAVKPNPKLYSCDVNITLRKPVVDE